MVQVFGNRIIGGIGAPDSRAAEAFGAGVSTTLGQRRTRQAMDETAQAMRMREQEFTWKGEDREEAKRRRAAAEAAAAAAKARSEAMAARYRDIIGAPGAQPPVAGLNVPAGTTARPAAPTTPARPAGVRAPASPPLSFGATVTGGGGAATVGGGAGADVLRGGGGADQLVAPVAAMDYSQFVAAARGGRMPTVEQLVAAVEAGNLTVQQAADVQAMIDSGYVPTAAEERAAQMPGVTPSQPQPPNPFLASVSDYMAGTLGGRTRGEQAAIDARRAELAAAAGQPIAPPAPATPAGANVPPEVAVTLPGGEQLVLSTGRPVPVTPTQLTFGPQLGAVPRAQEDIFVDNLVTQTGVPLTGGPGEVPLPPPMGEPGAPNRAVTRLLTERNRQLQLAQAALEFNDMQTYEAAAAKIMELDVALEAGVARMAINEARYSNAPQRLNAIWTDLTGMQYEFVPSAPGVYDTYVNGELFQRSVPVEMIAEETLMMADANYAQQQAALAQTRQEALAKGMGQAEANVFEYGQKAAIDAQKALMVGLTEIDLLAMKRDLGVGEQDQIDFQKDDTTGMILVFRNGEPAGQYAPVTENDVTGNPVTRYQRVQ